MVTIWGDGSSVRDYLDVDDMVAACRLALVGPNGIYNIGAGVGTSLNELIKQVQQITGRMLLVERQSTRASDAGRIVLDTARAKEVLGWGPSVGLREGLLRIWSGLQ